MTFKFSVEKAHRAQSRLCQKIVCEDRLPKKIRFVAGVDVAYSKNVSIGAVAVLDYNSLQLLESQTAIHETRIPYIPTLLAFREVPPAMICIKKLHLEPDVFLVDGHGVAHPYGCGFASHLGLVIRKPTIGVAKSRLIGKISKNGGNLLFHGKIIGSAVTSTSTSKRVYVSVGHMISLKTAVEIVRNCTRGTRIPEPIIKAHRIATAEKRKINKISKTV